jgi:glycosyltransferase involved in cell wall biosynthesis
MRALWITGNYYPQIGGLQVYVDRLTDSLSKYADVALVTEAGQDAPGNQHISHFSVSNLTRPASLKQWQAAADGIAKAISVFEPDVVHFSNANVAVYRPIVPEGIRTLATIHGNDLTAPWQLTPEHDLTTCIVEGLNACDCIFAVSNHSEDLAKRWLVRAPCVTITSGCDTDFFRPLRNHVGLMRRRYGVQPGIPMVLTVARLVPRKGHSCVLEALQRLSFRAHWVVVGDGPMREALLDSVEEAGMQEYVSLAGQVSNQDLLAIYNACDVFVLTPQEREFRGRLDSEGFGLVFHEAGACRKPVIGSEISGCQEAVIHGVSGLLVPPDDPQALAETLERMLTEPEMAQTLGRGGLALVRLLGGWSRVAQQVYETYESVLADQSADLVAR